MNDFRGTVRKPSTFLYTFLVWVIYPFLRIKYHLKGYKKEIKKIDGPAVILCNHPSFRDFLFVGPLLYPTKINFVLGYSFYNIKKITKLVYKLGAFPKMQFQNDVGSMKNMKKVIDSKGVLGVFPVGLVSECGEGGDIPLATAKLLKWLNVDVYVAKTKGSYMCFPKWAKNKRKGKIDVTFSKLVSKEDLKNYETNDLQQLVEKMLAFNEYEDNKGRKYKGKKLAEGLENLTYVCPKCLKEYTIVSENNKIICQHCGNEAMMDEYGHLHKVKEDDVIFETPFEWYHFERSLIAEKLRNNSFIIEDDAELYMPKDLYSPYSYVGSGHIVMKKDKLTYYGKVNDKDEVIELSLIGLPACAFNYGQRFEIQYHNTVYVFYPKNKQSVLKYSIAIRESYKQEVLEKRVC